MANSISNTTTAKIILEERRHAVTYHDSNGALATGPIVTYPKLELSTNGEPLVQPGPAAESKHILILGAGVSGLLVAWMLLDKGYRVSIFADDWAWTKDFKKSRMTSQIAGALWEFPPGGCGLTEIESVDDKWAKVQHYREWALQSYEFYDKYAQISNLHEQRGASLGLRFADLHQFFYRDLDNAEDALVAVEREKRDAIRTARDDGRMRGPMFTTYNEEGLLEKFKDVVNLDFRGQKFKSGYTHRAPIVNTDKGMAYLMALVKAKGANLETRSFESTIRSFGEGLLKRYHGHAIVNATGLGARDLAEDEDVYPVRGAVLRVENTRRGLFRHLNDAYLVPAQKDSHEFPTKTIFIVPRSDDVLYVGSIIQTENGKMNLSQESPEVQDMWDRAGDFVKNLRHAGLAPEYPFAQGLRPFTKNNAKIRADEKADFPLVHNYGHGGSGWTLGIGTARCVLYILEKLLSPDDGAPDTNRVRPEIVRHRAWAVNCEIYPRPPTVLPSEDTSNIQPTMRQVQQEVQEVKQKVEDVKREVQEVRQEVQGVNQEVRGVNQKVQVLQSAPPTPRRSSEISD
ncbi:D-amino-acid oxidase [Madurella mycetomatis]|uniref:D-amino-acid oxidase n=1 Tax=Madurella mycetomatis TaxID=100816 RepID=A0A175W3C7_9PEZI|nr:D-amino-acid oxidase [Madurella mycetomatis]